jgi:hypothetical protein
MSTLEAEATKEVVTETAISVQKRDSNSQRFADRLIVAAKIEKPPGRGGLTGAAADAYLKPITPK